MTEGSEAVVDNSLPASLFHNEALVTIPQTVRTLTRQADTMSTRLNDGTLSSPTQTVFNAYLRRSQIRAEKDAQAMHDLAAAT